MASTVWKGNLTFGLVSIPVRLLRAARAERVSLRQLHRPSRPQRDVAMPEYIPPSARSIPSPQEPIVEVEPVRRTYQPLTADAEAAPIAPTELVKGFEYAKDQYVIVEEQDLRAIAMPTSTEMQIAEFVHFSEIDPVYLETSYYVVPDGAIEKPYALLLEAMRSTGYAAIGQLTMHRRDHVMIVRPGKTGLIAHTMYYPDEVRSIEEFRTDTTGVKPKELTMATALIQALAQPFDPAQFRNNFRDRLRQLIDARAEGRQFAHAESVPPAATKVVDIIDALKRSLEQVQRKPATAERRQPKKRQSRA